MSNVGGTSDLKLDVYLALYYPGYVQLTVLEPVEFQTSPFLGNKMCMALAPLDLNYFMRTERNQRLSLFCVRWILLLSGGYRTQIYLASI